MARSEESAQRRLAMLAMKAGQLENAVSRQFALNEAAAEKILRLQQELEDQGSIITALVQLAGGRVELTLEELKAIPEGTKVAIAYPKEERPTFILALTHEDPAAAEARELASLEERLRKAGISEGEIEMLKRNVDQAAAQAGELFDGPHPDSPDAGDVPEQRKLSCGCVTCICSDGERCHGCGAKESPACQERRLAGVPNFHGPEVVGVHPDAGSVDPRAEASALVDASGRPLCGEPVDEPARP